MLDAFLVVAGLLAFMWLVEAVDAWHQRRTMRLAIRDVLRELDAGALERIRGGASVR